MMLLGRSTRLADDGDAEKTPFAMHILAQCSHEKTMTRLAAAPFVEIFAIIGGILFKSSSFYSPCLLL